MTTIDLFCICCIAKVRFTNVLNNNNNRCAICLKVKSKKTTLKFFSSVDLVAFYILLHSKFNSIIQQFIFDVNLCLIWYERYLISFNLTIHSKVLFLYSLHSGTQLFRNMPWSCVNQLTRTNEATIESTKTKKNFWIYLNLDITLNIKYGIIISSSIYTFNGENRTDNVLVAEGKGWCWRVYLHPLLNSAKKNSKQGLLCRSRSFKVIEVGTNRKLVCDFLLVINSNWYPISLY